MVLYILHGNVESVQVRKCEAVAKWCNVKVNYKSVRAVPADSNCEPCPVLDTMQGSITGSNAICFYLAGVNSLKSIGDHFTTARALTFLDAVIRDLEVNFYRRSALGLTSATEDIQRILDGLDSHFMKVSFAVGERRSFVDIALNAVLQTCIAFEPDELKIGLHLKRFMKTISGDMGPSTLGKKYSPKRNDRRQYYRTNENKAVAVTDKQTTVDAPTEMNVVDNDTVTASAKPTTSTAKTEGHVAAETSTTTETETKTKTSTVTSTSTAPAADQDTTEPSGNTEYAAPEPTPAKDETDNDTGAPTTVTETNTANVDTNTATSAPAPAPEAKSTGLSAAETHVSKVSVGKNLTEIPIKEFGEGVDAPATNSEFNLEQWKKEYANAKDIIQDAMPWFFENFIPEDFSIYKFVYDKMDDDCKAPFLASNMLGGFLQRIDPELRKRTFSVCRVIGEGTDYNYEGTFMFEGPGMPKEMVEHPSFEVHKWAKLNLDDEEHKKIFIDILANEDHTYDGEPIVDFKLFK